MQLAYGLMRLARSRDEDAGESFEKLVGSSWTGRSASSSCFWETVLVSALNERLESA